MTAQWEYRTILVRYGNLAENTQQKTEYAWYVRLTESKLRGWGEIFDYFGSQGWEIFSVVADTQREFQGLATGEVTAYRLFAKRPK